MIIENPEFKTITLKGLNMKKHQANLNSLRKKGWIPVSTRPDTKNMQMIYRLRMAAPIDRLPEIV